MVNKLGVAGFQSRPFLLSELLVPCVHDWGFYAFYSLIQTSVLSANPSGNLL